MRNYRLCAERNPSPGGKVAREAGRKRNSGDNLMSGTGKDFWNFYAFQRLFLRTNPYFSSRIPLPPQCAHWGTFSPGEGFAPAALDTVNDNLSFLDIYPLGVIIILEYFIKGAFSHVLSDESCRSGTGSAYLPPE